MKITLTQMSRPMEKICKVCGDKAIGFNFSVLTCESCKSFFRRNAQKMDTFKCRKFGTCEVDDLTRKCCPACRLEKCFQVGMRKEIINSSLDAAARRRSYSCTASTSHAGESGRRKKSNSFQQSPEEKLPSQSSPTSSLSSLPISPHTPSATSSPSTSSFNDTFIPSPIISLPPTITEHPSIFTLSKWEQKEIAAVHQATELAGFFEESTFQVVGEMTNLIEALNLAELYISKTIKFCKYFASFRALPQDDQLLLLKDFFTELMLVRICYVFVPEKDSFVVIQDEEKRTAVYVSLRILYQAQKQELLNFCREKSFEFQTELEKDPTIRDLILLQRLFKPREDTSAAASSKLIATEYLKYEALIKRYLTVKYRSSVAADAKLIRFEDAYHALALSRQMLESIFIYSGANQLAVLIKEIYNLI